MNNRKSPVRLAFITSQNPYDKKAWSGIYWFMLQSLQKEFERVEIIGPIERPFSLKLALGIIDLFHRLFFRKKYDKLRSSTLSKYYAGIISSKLKNIDIDVLFAPAASTEIASLKTNIPICYYSDSSFSQISEYYIQYRELSSKSKRESDSTEKKAIEKAAACVYSSAWATNYVHTYYKKTKDQLFTVKFGANLFPSEKINIAQKMLTNSFNLLFLGVDWQRKGGEKAVAAYLKLKQKGFAVKLTICGCNPPLTDKTILVIPFLDKNNPTDQAKLDQILRDTHLMLLPTEADCTPVVLNEAAAFSIPVIAADTGGISSQIEHGFNGFLAIKDNDYPDYAQCLLEDKALYQQMASNARHKFETALNWETWGEKMRKIIENIV